MDQLLVMDPLPSVDKAYSLVLRVESQRQRSINIEELNNNAAMMIRGAEYRRETGGKNLQQRKQHMDKRSQYCTHCAKAGHAKETCFKLHGYPEWFKELAEKKKRYGIDTRALNAVTSETAAGSQQEVLTQNLSAMMSELLQVMKGKTQSDPTQVHFARLGKFAAGTSFNVLSNTLGPNLWIIDSGATAHMCANLQLISNLKPYIADSLVILPDGTKHNVTHCGSVALSHDLSLNAILHVPSFKHNLLSVSKLVSSSNIAFIFSRDNCVVQDQRTRRTLAVGRLVGSLYVLDSHSFDTDEIKKFSMKSKTEICLNAHSNDAVLWHRRLGHTPLLVLRHTNVICGSSCELGICNVCPLAKQQRLPFLSSESCSENTFDLIHADIWGPYSQFSISGCTYMLTLVDDRSRATWVFLMKHKSQTMSFIEGFYQMIIRTDNDSEFVGDKCQSFIRNHGIIHQRTCVYSPQQNGVVERKHKHLLQVARALMFQSCLPSRFWTDAILTATYLINRLPTSVLHWKLPYEVLYNKAADYSIVRTFASAASDASATPPTVTFITPSHHAVMQAITSLREPTTYLEANASPEWRSAMQAELTALETNKTWEVTPLPPNHTPIGCRWIFKLKFNTDGSIERYEARLVAKGYNQIEGIDYNECFSPIAKSVTVRLFFAVAAALRWHIHQLDINNAFLHGYLEEEIYMSPPEGYSVPQGHVCCLKRSLYGLKQASRQWNHEFTTQIVAFGFVQSKHDYCLFTKTSTNGFLVLLLYVDDILVAGTSNEHIAAVKDYLDRLFTIKDLGVAQEHFLGLEVARSSQGIIVTQTKYIKDIMIDTGLLHARAATTPLPPGIKFTEDAGAQLPHPELYRRLVGRLLYLNFTRPDTSHACQQLSQFLQRPCQQHLDAALHLLIDTRRSLTGYCIFLGDALVSWKTKKQNTVSRSTTEAEYCSMGSDTTWVVYLLMDFGISAPTPIPFFCDNQAALHIVNNHVFHERTKHLDIDCHIVRDKFKSGLINPMHVPGKAQLADFFTKSLPAPSFFLFLSKLSLVDFTPSPTCGGLKEFMEKKRLLLLLLRQPLLCFHPQSLSAEMGLEVVLFV
ncbi:UNVERIFIED_CONTAM: Retrovirus-related Pol polyprotein from transposon RE1 [Sesamum indicum]